MPFNDPFRAAAYWAERQAFGPNSFGDPSSRPEFLAELLPFTEDFMAPGETIASFIIEIKALLPDLFPFPIRLVQKHRTLGASAARRRIKGEMVARLSFGPFAKRWVIVHELAHAAADMGNNSWNGHGPRWASIYVSLVRSIFGDEPAIRLNNAFARASIPGFSFTAGNGIIAAPEFE